MAMPAESMQGRAACGAAVKGPQQPAWNEAAGLRPLQGGTGILKPLQAASQAGSGHKNSSNLTSCEAQDEDHACVSARQALLLGGNSGREAVGWFAAGRSESRRLLTLCDTGLKLHKSVASQASALKENRERSASVRTGWPLSLR